MKTTGTTRGNASRIVTIKDIRRVVLPDAVRIVIELDGEVPTFHDERLANPIRVFVDLSATQAAPELIDRTIRFDSDADVVRQVRLGRHPNTTTRVVVDAAGVTSYSVYPLYSPYRLVIDFFKETAAKETAAPALATATLGHRIVAPTAGQLSPHAFPGAAAGATRAGSAGTSNRGADRYGVTASLCPAGAAAAGGAARPARVDAHQDAADRHRPAHAPTVDGGAGGRGGDDHDDGAGDNDRDDND